MKYIVIGALLGSLSQAISIKNTKVEETMDHFDGYTAQYNGFEGNN